MSKPKGRSKANRQSIGVFDSGIGGLSVLREIVAQLPHEDVIYFADSGHVPYGDREAHEIRTFANEITAYLQDHGAAIIVIACNTASAVALYSLREQFDIPIVGMEPAVKPAAEHTSSQHIGVIATRATFQGELFAGLVERFAKETRIHTQVCPELVQQVERGKENDLETEAILRAYLGPMIEAGIDSLVLGCTHYAFLRPTIERVVGPDVSIIDPAPAVARQTGRILGQLGTRRSEGVGQVRYITSGDPAALKAQVHRLVGIPGPVHSVQWAGTRIVLK